jgi:protein-tyrosine-phosphatase
MKRPSVLFACTLNRTRSPMAEGLARAHCGPAVVIDSCGVEPAAEFDPFMLAVLEEVGAGLDDRPGKGFEALEQGDYDLVVALTPEAHDMASRLAGPRGVAVRYWPTSDPTTAEGSREMVLDAYREVRDALSRRIRELFEGAIDLDRSIGV